MKILLLIISLAVCQIGLAQKSLQQVLDVYNAHSVSYISVQQLKQLTVGQKPVAILDARELDEFEVSRIPGAVYVGYKKFSKQQIANQIKDKQTPIVVYCSIGIRSEVIGERLQKMGYTNVKNLYGGIFEWKNNGYNVINKQGEITEQVHACNTHWSQWLVKGEKVYD
ncbi:MAG: rhodanese-like domain-containing protein [Gilvibacter sp.]